jgi:prepilin-type N-terminal cleavage/methylation domain-containing protein
MIDYQGYMMMNNQGFSLLEAMIAVFILAVGIMAAAAMQFRAIEANNNGMARTMANAMALSFMEELKRLPFDDPNLINTRGNGIEGLNDGSNVGRPAPDGSYHVPGGPIDPSLADHQFVPEKFPNFQNTYRIADGKIVDSSGRRYQIFWNTDKGAAVDGTPPASCRISLFVYWQTMMGTQHLHLTSVKYNNIQI